MMPDAYHPWHGNVSFTIMLQMLCAWNSFICNFCKRRAHGKFSWLSHTLCMRLLWVYIYIAVNSMQVRHQSGSKQVLIPWKLNKSWTAVNTNQSKPQNRDFLSVYPRREGPNCQGLLAYNSRKTRVPTMKLINNNDNNCNNHNNCNNQPRYNNQQWQQPWHQEK